MIDLVLVTAGGALGACARFWMSGVVARRVGETFPWGTLVVNVSGAVVIGLLAARLLTPEGVAEPWRATWLLLVTGVLGSYTTVSSFSLQTLALARTGEGGRAALNVIASLGLCLGAAFAGHQAGLRIFGG
ncbi:fluoride efflux transporter CrcB [Roseomonas rosulenta]|uniref:fluoride efflux transporter CrcB n=1 Tax=Roseomonas rosulenta TaxID=2748667 RepID=UPI001E477721|nr:fluoride efflux transporter CrcB [Roseomonas rosulenta]